MKNSKKLKFEVIDTKSVLKEDFVIDFRKTVFKELKARAKENNRIVIDRKTFNLGEKLYGKSKKESVEMQKRNRKQLLKLYKICTKAVKIIKRIQKINEFKFYVVDLDKKANNNDLMLCGMLSIRFNVNVFDRIYESIGLACDYLDKENELNKMCDFHDNHCTKHRDKQIDKITGCCPNFCKIRQDGKPCQIKNLSCKIFMCDYLINEKGYYFTPNTIPVLKKHLSIFERLACFGILFKSQKSTSKRLWGIRLFTALNVAVMIAVVVMICV